jgi:hypothetical protein
MSLEQPAACCSQTHLRSSFALLRASFLPCNRDYAQSIPGKSQLFITAFARALEVIPRQLADNSGFDATGE